MTPFYGVSSLNSRFLSSFQLFRKLLLLILLFLVINMICTSLLVINMLWWIYILFYFFISIPLVPYSCGVDVFFFLRTRLMVLNALNFACYIRTRSNKWNNAHGFNCSLPTFIILANVTYFADMNIRKII
jgi:hypothetical protein